MMSVLIFIQSTRLLVFFFFFFNDTATTEIYTLSLHDALPIFLRRQAEWIEARRGLERSQVNRANELLVRAQALEQTMRSEEHTSELQSPCNLVCRLLLEKKNTKVDIAIAYSTSVIVDDHSIAL